MKLTEKLDWLIDQWCERRELRPLQLVLRAYPVALAHTDQFGNVLDALKDVKSLCKDKLRRDELTLVNSLIDDLENYIKLRLRG